MLLSYFTRFLVVLWLCQTAALRIGAGKTSQIQPYKREALQDLVTWDQHSLFVRGERIMFFSGEFHPFRLPVPGMWLDVFQKIKALGFNGVSFYLDWSLLEGNPGHVVMDGIFDIDPFFEAASEAGIYLIARPGPYINAETASGGIPGWVLRIKGIIRSTAQDYLDSTQNYVATVGKAIAKGQITNGGPVIMVQPENEYASWPNVTDFPDEMNKMYMAFVEQQFRDAGLVVPFVINDNLNIGSFAPGTGLGAVDLYAIDAYPLRFDCSTPTIWPTFKFPTGWQLTHLMNSPTTPFAIGEFQGGAGAGWGGFGEDQCAILMNDQAVRVLWKNNWSFGATIFNVYMILGGTNWGNLGYHGGATTYDYGAGITEDRQVWREKYSEMKFQANFFKVSPAYLTATPGNEGNGSFVDNNAIGMTPLFGNGTKTNLYIARHADFTSTENATYKLTVSTSIGKITIPQLGGVLAMNGRDSKIHVTDYDVGGINMIYSTADIYTWMNGTGSNKVLVLYGGPGETHELAFSASQGSPKLTEGTGVTIQTRGSTSVIQWEVTPERRVVKIGGLEIHLLWRNEAYDYWPMELEAPQPVGNFSSISKSSVLVKAGYLLRSAAINGNELRLSGDVNKTTTIEVISVPKPGVTTIFFNDMQLDTSTTAEGRLTATVQYKSPLISTDFSGLQWKFIDSLPEIQPSYDDSLWTALTHTTTNNTLALSTPTCLYASDYGYHTGSLIYRGHFVANGKESTIFLNATGGVGFAYSTWLDDTFLQSWTGLGSDQSFAQTSTFPGPLTPGSRHVLTVVIDHMGQDEEAPGTDAIKFPRGLTDFALSGHAKSDVSWKLTGNLGGEQYIDLVRGPRNEGAMFAERQGFHLPNPPSENWTIASPIHDGIPQAGIGFFASSFELNVPNGYDIPMSFVFNGTATSSADGPVSNYRVQFFVNGYQYGKYVNNLGPQTIFPVPEGVLNHNGQNSIALTLWSLDPQGAKIDGFDLVPQATLLSGYTKPSLVPMPGWVKREGAY